MLNKNITDGNHMREKGMQIKTIFNTFRPNFLLLTPICVFLGLSISLSTTTQINWFNFILIMIGATLAHISVNTLNEYYDFKSGLDLQTNRTPFSGGSGALPENPSAANSVLIVSLISVILTILIGIYFLFEIGIQLLPIGLVGMIIVVTYTQWINRFPILCLISPGLGFGFLMVVGTYLILTGSYTGLSWLVPFVPFFLINNLLLLNQYPDIKADKAVGRNTFPIAFGVKNSNRVYFLFSIITCALITFGILNGNIPTLSFIAILPVLLSLFSFSGAFKHEFEIAEYPKYLKANVAAALLTPLLLGVTIING